MRNATKPRPNRSRMISRKAVKPRRLLNNAVAFYEASRRCSDSSKVLLGSPTVVCVAFAIEQFLKLLLLLERGEYPRREHALNKLFNRLPVDVRRRIDGNFDDWRGARHYLKEARRAFIEWRYPHEHKRLVASDELLNEIAVALRKTVRELYPDLVSVFEK